MNGIAHDLSEGIRRLRRSPGFTCLAMGTLALGLSASTAVFAYVNAYGRPIPGVGADGLHQVWFATDESPWGAVSFPDFQDMRARTDAPFEVTGVVPTFFLATVRHEELTEVAAGEAVAGGFFSALDITMLAGRGLSPEDDRPGATPATVISHDYWMSRYGGASDVIGRTILLNNEPYVIVGIVGPEFRGARASARPRFWIPLEQFLRVYRARSDTRENREAGAVRPIIRLAGGGSLAGAEDAVQALARGLDSEVPLSRRARRFVLTPATWISPEARASEASTTNVMLAAAGFLLLLACANVANLVLSAGTRRRSEMAIRTALGASGGRLARQLLVESLLLSVPAGLIAFALAGPVSRRLASYFARPSVWGVNVARDITVDPRVMLFAFGAAVVTGLATGLVPALRTSERSPAEAFGTRGTGASPGRASRIRLTGTRLPHTRELLVSAQLAICVVLLFVAALVLRTLQSVSAKDPGFDTTQTLASYVSTSSMGVPVEERHRFFEELVRRFDDLPWVEAVTVAENALLSGHPTQGLLPPDGSDPVVTTVARVWPGYFEALGMDLLGGRTFLDTDTVDANGVMVVNQSLAHRLSGDRSAVGQTLTWPGGDGGPDRSYEVVGVVRDASQVELLDPPGPVAYFSLPQQYSRPGNAMLLRVRGDPGVAVGLMERELRSVDTRLAIVNILPYRAVVRGALYTQRMNAELFTVIAALGLLFSATGVFAVLALAVAGRVREIAIRMAVGADRRAVAKAVLGPIGGSVLLGLAVGFAGAFGATRLVASLLWGVEPSDPIALSVGVGMLLTAVTVAIGVPLKRAVEVDPVISLRAE